MKNSGNLKKQWLITAPVLLLVCVAMLYVWASLDEAPQKPQKVELPSAKISTGKVWQDKVDDRTESLEKEIKELRDSLKSLKEATPKEKEQVAHPEPQNQKFLEEIFQRLNSLEGLVEESQQTSTFLEESEEEQASNNMQVISFSEDHDKKMLDAFLPAGTTMRAVLTTALHAPTGIGTAKNPHPVKFRVLDNAYFPKGVHAKIKGAIILGDAYGDLSSKRMRVRLQNLVLMKHDGSFEECKISGWVTGEDGAEGIGANAIIDHGDEIITYAGVASLFSSFGKYLEANVQNQQLSKIRTDDHYSSLSILKSAGAEGIAGGFDKIAEHWMQRLELIMPTVYVVAGRACDLHLSKTVELKSSENIQQSFHQEREMARRENG